MLDPNPFIKPTYAEEGNETKDELYNAVGKALTQWEHCETAFASLFTALIKPSGTNQIAFRAIGTVISASTRRELIEVCAESYFHYFPHEWLQGEVSQLLTLHRGGTSKRNEIAHATVAGDRWGKDAAPMFFLVPGIHSARKMDLKLEVAKYRYSTKELKYFTDCFEHLAWYCTKIEGEVRKAFEALPKELREQYS